jgi:signal transduction histidine kinase
MLKSASPFEEGSADDYASRPMSTAASRSPLAVTALALLATGATPSELADRFASLDAVVSERKAEALLEELRTLGLARAHQRDTTGQAYILTPLGERLLSSSLAGRPEHADLLAELEQIRTRLLATIAHELRTPLTAVRSSVGLLLDPAVELSPDQRRTLLETIDRNATRMQRVVGDILDLARLRDGNAQLQSRRFDGTDLARSAISSVQPLAARRRQAIELHPPAAPAWVFGDYRRLEQALVNLLSNAHRFSPDDAAITVTVESAGGTVSWTVSDRGPGIGAADRARLFERFFVARGDLSEPAGGIGLGLPITLAIAQAHEGRVDVDSRPGEGSRFTLVVPAEGPEDGAPE